MGDMNPMLAWYGPAVLDDLPDRLTLDPELEAQATDLTFRDDTGTWWRPQRDGTWLRHDPIGWTRADRPEALEGVAPLPVGVPAVHPTTGNEPPNDTPVEIDAPDGLARGVGLVCRSYRSGMMVSTMAELVLSDWMLATTDGRLWTIGAQTRTWYTYETDHWEPQTNPPDGPFISSPHRETLTEDTDTPARRWAEQGPFLPETITPTWLAPAPPDDLIPPAAPPGPPPASAPAWVATHTVPTEGLQAWAEPDPASGVIANLAAGVELEVVERREDWAHVRAENHWAAWVDGRRLLPVGGTTPGSPDPPAPASPGTPTVDTTVSSALDAAGERPVPLIAAIALLVSAFMPWWGEDGLGSFSTSLFHVWNGSYEPTMVTIGLLVLIVGVAAIATVLADWAARYRRVVGWAAVGVSVVWLLLTYGYLIGVEEWSTAFAELFTTYFALGPWVALVAGITLLVKA